MAEDKGKKDEKKKKDANIGDEVWSAISAFEQILEAMPNDRSSLEALSNAYHQIGDHTKAMDYAIRLGHVVVDEGDTGAAGDLLQQLKGNEDADPRIKELVEKIEALGIAAPEAAPDPESQPAKSDGPAPAAPGEVRTTFNIADELSFAWNLMEANELTQEEYASVVQDLTELSAGDAVQTISVLHVLESRGFKNLEKVLAHVARECSAPIVSLASFDTQSEVALAVPREFMIKRGAFVFEFIGDHALVVVMNPYDQQLRKDVESAVGRTCHFYVARPSDFDSAVERAGEMESSG